MPNPRRTCLITVHAAPPVRDRLTLEIESDDDPAFVEALKREIPYHDRFWDKERGRWYAAPDHLAAVRQLALTYDAAWLIEDGGRRRTDLHTGASHTQGTLF